MLICFAASKSDVGATVVVVVVVVALVELVAVVGLVVYTTGPFIFKSYVTSKSVCSKPRELYSTSPTFGAEWT